MRGKRGVWTVGIVVLVALLLGLATIPLLKERRRREVGRTANLLKALHLACANYRAQYGVYPPSLDAAFKGRIPTVDAWGRPILYEIHNTEFRIWSQGPVPEDPSDDIVSGGSPVP